MLQTIRIVTSDKKLIVTFLLTITLVLGEAIRNAPRPVELVLEKCACTANEFSLSFRVSFVSLVISFKVAFANEKKALRIKWAPQIFLTEILVIWCEILRKCKCITAWSLGCAHLVLVANTERNVLFQSLLGTVILKASVCRCLRTAS